MLSRVTLVLLSYVFCFPAFSFLERDVEEAYTKQLELYKSSLYTEYLHTTPEDAADHTTVQKAVTAIFSGSNDVEIYIQFFERREKFELANYLRRIQSQQEVH